MQQEMAKTVENLTQKTAEMEEELVRILNQKEKLLEKIILCQDNQNAKISVIEGVLD